MPPIVRVGGKHYMIKHLLKMIPSHVFYVEVFGGAGHLLFAKEPSKVEVYNDLDSAVYTFYKVVRERKEELLEKLDWTLYSREEFEYDRKHIYDEEIDDVEKARRFFVSNALNPLLFTCSIGNKTELGSTAVTFRNKIEMLDAVRERLKYVTIENKDFRFILKTYDRPETFFYLDPPYVINTRLSKGKMYKHEMTEFDHGELVDILLSIKGKVLLSGYDNEIYSRLEENGWHTRTFTVNNVIGNKFSDVKKVDKVIEKVWYNYELGLFDI
ncbi:MAG: DNA adenine methylase [Athalassotoga sp.]